MNGRAIPGAYLFRLCMCVSANEYFGQRMWFRNELSSSAEVSLYSSTSRRKIEIKLQASLHARVAGRERRSTRFSNKKSDSLMNWN